MCRPFLAILLAPALATIAMAQASTTSTTLPGARVLYTTAAVADRVEGFCLGPNGGMALRPVFQQPTEKDANPRRLIIAPSPHACVCECDQTSCPQPKCCDVLYVAGRHKVESFRIGRNGGLTSIGKTKRIPNANPLDIAVSDTHVYVPNRGANRVEAYVLNPETGGIIENVNMSSCATVPNDVTLQDLEVGEVGSVSGSHVLYVTASTSQFVAGKKGRIDVFQLDANGELPDLYNDEDPDAAMRCGATTSTSTSTSMTTLVPSTSSTSTTTVTTSTSTTVARFTPPYSTRKKLRGPTAFVLSDVTAPPDGVADFIYVYDVYARRVIEFGLTNGLFDDVDDEEQARISATNELGRLLDLIGFEGVADSDPIQRTLLGAADNQGRVRTFALKLDENGNLTKAPKNPRLHQTNRIFDSTPVRITVGRMDDSRAVLYLPAGTANRIHGYRIKKKKKNGEVIGFFPEPKAFSSTEKRQATFPNDAAVAHIDGKCPCKIRKGTCP